MTTLDHLIDEDARAMVPTTITATRTERVVVNLALLASAAFVLWAFWQATA